jgi:signal transduction histidine kinase
MRRLAYVGVIAVCFLIGTLAGWTSLAVRIDHYAYDLMTRFTPPPEADPHSVVVAIDEETLQAGGGMRRIRSILAEVLAQVSAARPKAVALDVILSDPGDPAEDGRLETALRSTPDLVLPCEVVAADAALKWEDPLPRFSIVAKAIGHVHPEQDRLDGVSREISLEQTAEGPRGRERRWALALEAFRIFQGAEIVESPDDVAVGATVVPAARSSASRSMFIRFLPAGVPVVPALHLAGNSSVLNGKAVFVGITALSAARDRLVNPYGQNVPGVEVHSHAFETLMRGRFLRSATNLQSLGVAAMLATAAGLAFAVLSGWVAYAAAILVLGLAHVSPIVFFRQDVLFPYFGPSAVAWLSCAGAATFQYFFVRRQLRRTESEKSRYQQAIHWAAHEMRTPLTTIQGSSEIMTRYALPEEKRLQLNETIHSESKRLARIIQTFLDVERLAEGQMELKREAFSAREVVEACVDRIRPLAGRKNIDVSVETPVAGMLTGDRELMDYAIYNLLTNAVKYSPANTAIRVRTEQRNGELRISVHDQGIGMDAKELKQIFRKFYRTKSAEASGEAGTGIGLSIVEQIVTHHGGRMEVTSEPGKGSCFTMVISANAETAHR